MKLIFYPMLLFSLAEIRYGSGDKSVIRCSTMAENLLALLLIPVMYYTYTGSLGISAAWFNVTIFFLSAGAACCLGYRMEEHHFTCRIRPEVWAAGMVLIAVLFTAATFRPPRIPLFRDPVTGTYGIFGIV